MRTINIWALILVILGLVLTLLLWMGTYGGSGMVMFFGSPLIVIGIILWIIGRYKK